MHNRNTKGVIVSLVVAGCGRLSMAGRALLAEQRAEYTYFKKNLNTGLQHTHLQLYVTNGADGPSSHSQTQLSKRSGLSTQQSDLDVTFSPYLVRSVDAPAYDPEEDKIDTCVVLAAEEMATRERNNGADIYSDTSHVVSERKELQKQIYDKMDDMINHKREYEIASEKRNKSNVGDETMKGVCDLPVGETPHQDSQRSVGDRDLTLNNISDLNNWSEGQSGRADNRMRSSDDDRTIGADQTDRKIAEIKRWEAVDVDCGTNTIRDVPDMPNHYEYDKPESVPPGWLPMDQRFAGFSTPPVSTHSSKESFRGRKSSAKGIGGKKSSRRRKRASKRAPSGRKKLTMSETNVRRRNRPRASLVIPVRLVDRCSRSVMRGRVRLSRSAVHDLTALVETYTCYCVSIAGGIAGRSDRKASQTRITAGHVHQAHNHPSLDLLSHMIRKPTNIK